MNLGMVLGPGLGGLIAEMGIRMPYFFAAGLGLIAALMTLLLPETLPRRKERSPSVFKKEITWAKNLEFF